MPICYALRRQSPVLGVGLHAAGTCPVVKRVWTSAWVLYSGGWRFLLLVLGMNSIVA
jgi:predicted acyltransferase